MKSALVKLIGFPATLIHGDTLVLDRWQWLSRRLPRTAGSKLIDVGCGTGAFTIGAARKGYDALGLSWDERNQNEAALRAQVCNAPTAHFEILDVRKLDQRPDLYDRFDVAISLECIEHILDDQKLMTEMAKTLKPGGRLLLTTPYLHYKSITKSDDGPFQTEELGWHVRRGYDEARLRELATNAGLVVDSFTYCSGFTSQKVTFFYRHLVNVNLYLGWALTLPFRILPPLLDPMLSKVSSWPAYSICLEAHRPS